MLFVGAIVRGMEQRTGAMSAAEFFGLGLDGVTLTAAQTATGLAYTTVLRARDRGPDCDPATARKLAAWSRTVPAAQAAGVWIDAARTLGLVAETDGPVIVRDGFDQTEGV